MKFFARETKEDCFKYVEKINREMRAISAAMHRSPINGIDSSNYYEIFGHFRNIVSYGQKFDNIKKSLPVLEQLDLDIAKVYVWNGKETDCGTWRFLTEFTLNELYDELNKR